MARTRFSGQSSCSSAYTTYDIQHLSVQTSMFFGEGFFFYVSHATVASCAWTARYFCLGITLAGYSCYHSCTKLPSFYVCVPIHSMPEQDEAQYTTTDPQNRFSSLAVYTIPGICILHTP